MKSEWRNKTIKKKKEILGLTGIILEIKMNLLDLAEFFSEEQRKRRLKKKLKIGIRLINKEKTGRG